MLQINYQNQTKYEMDEYVEVFKRIAKHTLKKFNMKGNIAEIYRGCFKSICWGCIKYMQNCHNNNCGELSLCLFMIKYKLKD